MVRTLLFATVLVLAGCTAPAAQEAQAPQPSAETPAPAPLDATVAPSANATAPRDTLTPLSYKGSTGTGACGFVTVGHCAFPVSGSNDLMEVPVSGKPTHLAANITWTAATPATQQMRALLAHKEGDGWFWRQGDPMAEGPSPLALDWDLARFNTSLAIAVDSGQFQGTGPVGIYASTAQDFAVEGTVHATS